MISETEEKIWIKNFRSGVKFQISGHLAQISNFRKVGNLNIKMTLLKSTFQNSSREVTQGKKFWW